MEQDKVFQNEVEELLRQRIGLNSESVGSRAVLRAVKKGMRQHGISHIGDYLAELKTTPALFDSLVEAVVVPETSFFRNRVSYGFLRRWIANEWKPTASRPLRVLSLPCSTGEEPYSIAIMLLEEGLGLSDFHLDAVDISAAALERAKKGIFSPYAFRRRAYRNNDKYFSLALLSEQSAEGFKLCNSTDVVPHGGRQKPMRYVLTDTVREKVVFRQGNVLDAQLLADELPYDIVFCRNMLIYFDRVARDRTAIFLNRVLRPDGLLFVGYAESGLIDNQSYQPVPYPQTFAFYKRSPQSGHPDLASLTAQAKAFDSPNQTEASGRRSHDFTNGLQTVLPIVRTLNGTATHRETDGKSDLETARELADKGALEQATELCDRYLAAHPGSAEAHLLRGELYQSSGNEMAAEDYFGRAAYLNPQMREALTHLLMIHEGRQALEKAAVMRSRLQRLDRDIKS